MTTHAGKMVLQFIGVYLAILAIMVAAVTLIKYRVRTDPHAVRSTTATMDQGSCDGQSMGCVVITCRPDGVLIQGDLFPSDFAQAQTICHSIKVPK